MAAVEDCAGATDALSTEAGLTSLDSESEIDMKNTARKSTTKLAQLTELKRAATPPLVANGNKVDLHSNKNVVNGDGPTKRPSDVEEQSNAAKVARLHLEEMENAQSEMTKKVNRDGTLAGSADKVSNEKENTPLLNGDMNGKDTKDSLENSNDSNSKSNKGNSSLAIAANVKDTFKGILNVAMANVESSASREGTALRSSRSSSPTVQSQKEDKDSQLEVEESPKTNGKPDPEDVVIISSQEDNPNESIEEKDQETSEAALEDKLLEGEEGDADADPVIDEAALLLDDQEKEGNREEAEKDKDAPQDGKDGLSDKDKVSESCDVNSDSELKTKESEAKSSENNDKAEGSTLGKESAVVKKDVKKPDIPPDMIIDLDGDDEEEQQQKDEEDNAKKCESVSEPTTPIEIEDEDDKVEGPDSEKATVNEDSKNDSKMDTDADSKSSDISEASQRKRPGSPHLSESSIDAKKCRLEENKDLELKPAAESPKVVETAVVDLVDEKPEEKPEVKKVEMVESGKELVTLSLEDLNDLLKKRMNAFLHKWRGSPVVQLQNRISELQSSVESWRAQAKKLAKQLEEEVAKNAQRKRNTGRMVKRGMNKEDHRTNQAAAVQQQQLQHQQQQQQQQQQQNQQQAGMNKVLVRTPARSSPQLKSPPSMQVINNQVRVNNQQVRMPPAEASQAKSATVRDLLDKQRGTEPVKKSQTVQIQGNRIVVPGSQLVARKSVTGAAVRQVQVKAANGPNSNVIDLTDDDDQRSEAAKSSGRAATTPTSTVQIRGSTQNIRPGTQLLVQQNNSNSPQVLVASQAMRTAQGTLLYTTRPGSLMVQTTPGTSLVRPANTVTAPPALRPANLVTISRAPAGSSTATVVTPRPPPPLRSAPTTSVQNTQARHPAPLPAVAEFQTANVPNPRQPPPRPGLKISRVQSGIVLSWNMTITEAIAQISNYQLFAYQETSAPPSTSLWKKVGDVKALPLPMACTLTQFQEGNKYHFAVRAVDIHGRIGPFSEPSTIALTVINVS